MISRVIMPGNNASNKRAHYPSGMEEKVRKEYLKESESEKRGQTAPSSNHSPTRMRRGVDPFGELIGNEVNIGGG
jgi:hypothetical protein